MKKEDYLKRWVINPEEFIDLNDSEMFNEEFIWELLMILGTEKDSKAYVFLEQQKEKLAEHLSNIQEN